MRLADVTPLNPWTTRAVRIDEVTREMDGVSTYQLRFIVPSSADEYHFSPGQFNMLYLPGVGESAVSMSGNPNGNDSWIHTVRVAGNVTRTLAGLDIGDTLGLRGPFGKGWPVSELKGCDVVIVAGGLGMAPLRPLIYELMARREEVGKIWLICGARSAEGLLYSKEWENWRRKGIDVQLTVDIPNTLWEGHIGVVTLLVDRIRLDRPKSTQLVCCGPEVMMRYTARSGMKLGIETNRIWLSLERNMQCAVGLCGHCQLGPEFICKDGPVIRYDRLQHFLSVEQL